MRFIIATQKTKLPPLGLALALFLLCASGCRQNAAPAPSKDAPAADSKTGAGDAKAGGAAASEAPASADLPTVSTAVVQTGTAEKTLPVTGTLAAFRNQQAALSAPVAGIIDALPVRVGQTVVRGQIVLHLSPLALEGR